MTTALTDTFGRPLRDLRISVTDRCNFRCSYCMPKDVFGPDHAFLPREAVLTYEEVERFARLAVGLGVRKLRITGGEPLLRRDVHLLVQSLASIEGVEDLALTTNGAALATQAPRLAEAGLHRVTVSLDALDDALFRRMNDMDFPVARVLEGIDAATAAGLGPVKVNMVVQRGINEDQIVPMAQWFRGRGVILRFIEFMDVGTTNGWSREQVVGAEEIIERLEAAGLGLETLPATEEGEVARRYAYADGEGEIGVIASVTRPFCRTCTRLRLSADGRLFTCLFATQGFDLKSLMRRGASDEDLRTALTSLWGARTDRWSEIRAASSRPDDRIEMSYIGG
ncbi:MAG: GTP 3',8-cyclase MoaA [Planctomycetes bacterium]|nr:GTP 3',8-cyclase MoaA [Planctomycetota bacterium]MCB9828688.1 GTP 3',8-cyclase MoaA [Planctomycetota bacterium]MCB9901052.1 GTP 3',8-cyclase MoaA [Planctomycetota bacterium]